MDYIGLFELKGFRTPLSVIKEGDIVHIKDSDLDWLRDFYNSNCDGNPISCFSKKFAIEVVNDNPNQNPQDKAYYFLVRSLDENDNYIQVDLYVDSPEIDPNGSVWTEVLINNRRMRECNGHYIMDSYFISRGSMDMMDAKIRDEISAYVNDVTRYILLFFAKKVNDPSYVYKDKKNEKKKTGKNKKAVKHVRRTVYVPNKITVLKEKERKAEESKAQETTSENAKVSTDSKRPRAEAEYSKPEWKARGYTRKKVNPDGTITEIQVSASTRRRNPKLMNKARKKGIDYKVKKS